jgi:hypothetical protein
MDEAPNHDAWIASEGETLSANPQSGAGFDLRRLDVLDIEESQVVVARAAGEQNEA